MDAQTQARWDAWAKGVAQGVFKSMFPSWAKIIAEGTVEVLRPVFKSHKDRMAALELRIANLEKARTGETTEWPIPERTDA